MLEAASEVCFIWSVSESLDCDDFYTKLDNSQTLFVYFRKSKFKGVVQKLFQTDCHRYNKVLFYIF